MPPRRVQKAPRKRTGCASCKSAHVKCTEDKPACRRCQRLSLPCQYEFKLLWEQDSFQRNIVHGRAGVWSRDGKKPDPIPGTLRFCDETGKEELVWTPVRAKKDWEFTNFSPDDFVNGLPSILQSECLPTTVDAEAERPHGSTAGLKERDTLNEIHEGVSDSASDKSTGQIPVIEERRLVLNLSNPSPTITWTCDTEPQTSPSSCLPLRSFTGCEAQLLNYYIHELSPKCSLSVHLNPYLKVLLPVAFEFEPLRHTLLATSACQLYHLTGDRQYELSSLSHRSKAIRGLNTHLGKERADWKSLATIVMFCFRDITDGCEPSWITHLQMGMRMLRELLCSSRIDKDLRKFCEIYFVTHDVMGRTAWEKHVTDFEHYEWDRDEGFHEIDSIMGCSRELISLISQISCLTGTSRQEVKSVDNIMSEATNLMGRLSSVHQSLRAGVEHAETMLRIAEVKRLSAMLYLHDRVMAPYSNRSSNFAHNLRRAIIEAIQQLPVSSAASLWPLFVLGKSNLNSKDQAQFVLDRLHQLEQSRYLGSFHHARRRVERNIMRRLTADGDVLKLTWEDDLALNDNERWVSLA